MQVLIVDDHPLVHATLTAVARAAIPRAAVHVESTLPKALSRARGMDTETDLVLLDLGLPGCIGMEALTRFRAGFPNLRVTIVSANDDAASVEEAIQAGALGYIPKTSKPGLMIAALKLVASGGIYVPPEVMEKRNSQTLAKKSASMEGLGITERQVSVLRLLMKGLGNREIGRELDIAENTVKQHLHAAFRALGVGSRTEALIALARKGIKFD